MILWDFSGLPGKHLVKTWDLPGKHLGTTWFTWSIFSSILIDDLDDHLDIGGSSSSWGYHKVLGFYDEENPARIWMINQAGPPFEETSK